MAQKTAVKTFRLKEMIAIRPLKREKLYTKSAYKRLLLVFQLGTKFYKNIK